MGYYSDVAISMYENDYKKLCKAAESADEEVRRFMNQAAFQETKLSNGSAMTLIWDCVKWRDDYKDVKFVEDFLKTISDYSFKRIGEVTDDVEERLGGDDSYELDDIIHIERCFCVDGEWYV